MCACEKKIRREDFLTSHIYSSWSFVLINQSSFSHSSFYNTKKRKEKEILMKRRRRKKNFIFFVCICLCDCIFIHFWSSSTSWTSLRPLSLSPGISVVHNVRLSRKSCIINVESLYVSSLSVSNSAIASSKAWKS